MSDEYNGWTNRETWALNLHLTNDEALYDDAREIVATDKYGDDLREWIERLAEDVFDAPGGDFGAAQTSREVKMMVQETGSLWRVNWRELRDSLTDEEYIRDAIAGADSR